MFQPSPPCLFAPILRFYPDRQDAADRDEIADTAAAIDLRSRRTRSAMPPISRGQGRSHTFRWHHYPAVCDPLIRPPRRSESLADCPHPPQFVPPL